MNKMKNNKVTELKNPPKAKNVDERSKVIKKKTKNVKKLSKLVTSKAALDLVLAERGLSAVEVAKINKKKAKKLRLKLKKQEKKMESKSRENGEANADKVKKEKKAVNDEKCAADDVENKKLSKANKKKNKSKNSDAEQPKIAPTDDTPKTAKQIQKATKKAKRQQLLEEKKNKAPNGMDPNEAASTVFVGNLPINTKRVQLQKIFKSFGEVKAIRFRTAGGQRIFKSKQRKQARSLNAYIVLDSPEATTRALKVNGSDFKGNHLRVTHSAKDAKAADESDAKRTVFVGNLKYSTSEEQLREIFSSCGEIDYVRCLQDGKKGCNGVAYVCFKSPDAVGLALELNETILEERPIHVERYSVKKLGAREARENTVNGTKQKTTKTGALKRIEKKQKQKSGKQSKEDGYGAAKKKNEYRGVKVDSTKKKLKKKKVTSQMTQLAKKIAPKSKDVK